MNQGEALAVKVEALRQELRAFSQTASNDELQTERLLAALRDLRHEVQDVEREGWRVRREQEGYDPVGGGGGHGRSDLPHGMGGGGD